MQGKELRSIRGKLGWTQVQMAEAVGVAANTIARYERDVTSISEPVARLVTTIYAARRHKELKKKQKPWRA